MSTSDWIAALALVVSLLAFVESRRAGTFTKRQYAAERREETLASARLLRDALDARIRELELLLSKLEFQVPAKTIIQVNAMIEATRTGRASLESTIANMQDDRSLDRNDVVHWFNIRREIQDIGLDDKRITEKIRAFREGLASATERDSKKG